MASAGSAPSAPFVPAPPNASPAITVVVRKRPKLPDKERDETDVVRCSPEDGAVVVYEPRTKLDLTPVIEPSAFSFDRVFSEQSRNEEVHAACCRPLLANVRAGGGAVVFAFGQTGSGKTFTMLGSDREPGLYSLAVTELLETPGISGLSASFYEVYGTKLFDLLNDRAEVKMLQDEYKNIHIVGLTERDVCSLDDVTTLMTSGQQLRAVGTTHANDRSSRSHAVLEIRLRPSPAGGSSGDNSGEGAGRITFVDLAGSERASDTSEADARTRREGAEINKSLLALKECIRAMSLRKRHIPFRGSKLTLILRESFTGRCRTCVIATISPCQSHCEDTLNTLRYADRIKELKGPDGTTAGAAGLQTPTPCRSCGQPIFVGDKHVCRRQVVECPHCRRTMDRTDLEQHLNECREAPQRCPHCNERVLRGDLPRHNRRCQRLPVRCTACGAMVVRSQLERHSQTECAAAKTKCRHCGSLFPRQGLATHEANCDAARVACPYCLKYVKQRRLDAHAALCFLNPNRTSAATTPAVGAAAAAAAARNAPCSSSASPTPSSIGGVSTPVTDRSLPWRGPPSCGSSLSRDNASDDGAVAGLLRPQSGGLWRGMTKPSTASSLPPPGPVATAAAASRPSSQSGRPGSGRRSAGAVRGERRPVASGRRAHSDLPFANRSLLADDGGVGGSDDAAGASGAIGCPYARFGCAAMVSQWNLSEHLKDCVHEHLQLLSAYADRVDAQNADLRRLIITAGTKTT